MTRFGFKIKRVELTFPCTCGVLSDTHARELLPEWKHAISIYFRDVRHVLHLGDVVYPAVFNDLETLGFEVVAVRGNNDRSLMTPHVIILRSGPYTIGMTHGAGGPYYDTARRVKRLVQSHWEGPLDLILHGHTHVPFDDVVDGVRVINPGSLALPRTDLSGRFPSRPSMGLLMIEESGIHFHHIFLE